VGGRVAGQRHLAVEVLADPVEAGLVGGRGAARDGEGRLPAGHLARVGRPPDEVGQDRPLVGGGQRPADRPGAGVPEDGAGLDGGVGEVLVGGLAADGSLDRFEGDRLECREQFVGSPGAVAGRDQPAERLGGQRPRLRLLAVEAVHHRDRDAGIEHRPDRIEAAVGPEQRDDPPEARPGELFVVAFERRLEHRDALFLAVGGGQHRRREPLDGGGAQPVVAGVGVDEQPVDRRLRERLVIVLDAVGHRRRAPGLHEPEGGVDPERQRRAEHREVEDGRGVDA